MSELLDILVTVASQNSDKEEVDSEVDGSKEAGPPQLRPLRVLGYLVGALVVVALAYSTLFGSESLPDFAPTGPPRALPEAGSVPVVSLQDFEGLLVGQEGKPVVVNIWASWCPPCRAEMPLLERASQTFAGEAVILGVISDDDPDSARDFLDRLGISYPNVVDGTGEIRHRLEMSVFPTTYIFGRDGQLRTKVQAGVSEQQLAALIEDALR